MTRKPGKKETPITKKVARTAACALVLFAVVSFLVLKIQGRNDLSIGLETANAENKEHGGEEKKAEAEGHGEKKAEEGHGEKKEDGGHGGGEEGKTEDKQAKEGPDPKALAEKRKREAAEARRELMGLEEKRLYIKKQEEKLKAEQERLKALKQEMTDKVSELETMHRKIEESLQKIERKRSEKEGMSKEVQDKKIKQLVKMYSTMKPKQAGLIFNSMDIVIAEKILMNMKGDAAGKILAYVESNKAALISERLAISVGRTEGRP